MAARHDAEQALHLSIPPPPAGDAALISTSVDSVVLADPFDRSWSTTAWLETAGIFDAIAGVLREQTSAAVLADAIGESDWRERPQMGPISEPKDDLSLLRKLACGSESELQNRLEGVESAVARALRPRLSELATASAVTSAHELHDKFVQDPRTFELRFEAIGAFYGGLEAMIGSPDPNVRTAMEREHTAAADSGDEFTTDNYEVTTTPTIEWWFVAEPEGHVAAWPAEHKIEAPAAPRRPLTSSQLAAVLRRKNAELEKIDADLLLLEEALAARLYTGPMFIKYNDTVRGFGDALAGCKGNRYVTTTHAINSCIVKASKLTKVAKVYRGVAGGVLPDAFWTADEYGVRGGVERAFQSTSYDKAVAARYAGGRPGASLLFEIDMGMVDRGCELDWISQYPHERECLFAPLTGLQLVRTRVEGGMLVAELRLSINLNALTLEQVIGKMKSTVLNLAGLVQLERPSVELQALRRELRARDAAWFNDPNHFKDSARRLFVAGADAGVGREQPRPASGISNISVPSKLRRALSVATPRMAAATATRTAAEWTAASWLDSIGVAALIKPMLLGDAPDELSSLMTLDETLLKERLRALPAALARVLHPHLLLLVTGQATGAELHHKFVQDPNSFTLQFVRRLILDQGFPLRAFLG